MRFFGPKRKIRCTAKTSSVAGEVELKNAVVDPATLAALAAFDADKSLDNAGSVHAEIVTAFIGDVADVKGLDVLRAAYDVSKGFITEYDPPIAVLGVNTIAAATSLAIAVTQWISDKAGTAEIDLLRSDTFVQDTLTPGGYWTL